MTTTLIIFIVIAALGFAGYLSACAGAQRWLTFREWWGVAKHVHGVGSASGVSPADPCPHCERGGTCNTPECGRKRSSELMSAYGVDASEQQSTKGGA